jgi:hypothetical protein
MLSLTVRKRVVTWIELAQDGQGRTLVGTARTSLDVTVVSLQAARSHTCVPCHVSAPLRGTPSRRCLYVDIPTLLPTKSAASNRATLRMSGLAGRTECSAIWVTLAGVRNTGVLRCSSLRCWELQLAVTSSPLTLGPWALVLLREWLCAGFCWRLCPVE